ncbi:hypothetical protein [Nostoc flagelliforme]|nr:hypothetical protein [Nostoc flagelliforme]
MGKLNCPYLTTVEEKLLGLIEREYGVIPIHNSQWATPRYANAIRN